MADRTRKAATPVLEWVSAIVGGLIALALIAIIGREAVTGANHGPAELVVVEQRVVPSNRGFVVEVGVRNDGDSAAAAVQIEGALRQGQSAVETSRATLDYVPGNSSRKAGLIFSRDPAGYRLDLRAGGYAEP